MGMPGSDPASRGARAVNNAREKRLWSDNIFYKHFEVSQISIKNIYFHIKPSLFNNVYCLCSPRFRLKAGMTTFGWKSTMFERKLIKKENNSVLRLLRN
jgi:hypothetical protein